MRAAFAKSEPKGDGRGGLKDVCKNCGKDFVATGAGAPSTNGQAPPRAAAPGRKCTVEGCPGTLAGDGICGCCAKRAEWAADNLPVRKCELCDGPIEKGKRCPPCAKLYTKSQLFAKKK